MNIGQLMRAILGDMQPAEPKTLELKVGQIVKGMVLQLLAEQEALVNIGGVQVKARLEAPLQPGQSTMLQVQPDSQGSRIVLKPLGSSEAPIAGDSLGGLLREFGLPDGAARRQLVQDLHRQGLPLTKEAVRDAVQAADERPAGVPEDEWRQTVVLAARRGLPVSEATVAPLHRLVFGAPMGKSMQALSGALAEALAPDAQRAQAAAAPAGAAGAVPLRDVMAQAKALLDRLAELPGRAAPAGPGAETAQPARSGAGAAERGAPQAARAVAPAGAAGTEAAARGPAAGAAEGEAAGTAVGERAAGAAAGGPPADRAAALTGGGPLAERSAPDGAARLGSSSAPHATAVAVSGGAAAAEPVPADGRWLRSLLQSLGVELEHALAKLADAERAAPAASPGGPLSPVAAPQADTPELSALRDTLKPLLLQLADDGAALPAAVKEAAQQLLQQITGQQLLLTPDRFAPFAHLTVMVPLLDGSGQQSAAIHIQSRKGRNGQLDVDNCRLLFDLNMQTLGSTLVDVQVVDKIVSLHVHNDHTAVAELLEAHRHEIGEGLRALGFQFSSLRCSAFPQPSTTENVNHPKDVIQADAASRYSAKPYKGVDIRV